MELAALPCPLCQSKAAHDGQALEYRLVWCPEKECPMGSMYWADWNKPRASALSREEVEALGKAFQAGWESGLEQRIPFLREPFKNRDQSFADFLARHVQGQGKKGEG
jgi:hypothetical protein